MTEVPARAALAAAAVLVVGGAQAAPPRIDLDVALEPATRVLRVEASLHGERVGTVTLHRNLSISAATLDGEPVSVQPGPVSRDLREWRLARTGTALRIAYGGTLAPLDRGADHRRVLRALPPMASPEGSFLPSAGAWFPAPGGLYTYRVRLSLPAGQRGLVAGDLVEERIGADGERTVATFEMRAPTDGIDLMAGPYVVAERVVERPGAPPLRLRTYFTPAIEALAQGYLDDSQRYIERYAKRIGAYPFASFSVVASPLPTGFGMPTLTYIGEAVLRLPFIRATSLGHEVLHNWWGNGVYVDYASGNWAEGLTTFMADYAYKEDASAEAARERRLGWLRDFAALPSGAAKPLSAFRSRAHGADAATGYGKAAMVFLMLRDLIGEAAFDDGVRRFWDAQRFRTASWHDLRAAFESASGRDLSRFFAQWLERADAPAPRIVSAQAQGGGVEVALAQGTPPYALRVPLAFEGPAGSTTRFVNFARSRETIRVDEVASATSVRLDPDLRLWRALDPQTLPPILRQWILARAPRYSVVSDNLRGAAESLAARLFEHPARRVDLADPGNTPLLLVGTHADVDAALARLGLPARPAEIARRGSAQVWTVARAPGETPVAVISARDAASVAALERPLPHYGGQSFLAFDGRRALVRGVWPVRSPITAIAR
ncbi:MAG: M1 family aminopeptidase [Burkholderiales bacterium]|nr:M1 family aminopeptidase [Burkholderiales bacterium]